MKTFVITGTEDRVTPAAVEESATRLVSHPAVLVVTRSGILERTLPVAVTGVDVALNQDLKALAPGDGIESRYIAYFLRLREQDILRACAKDGTTVASVESEKLYDTLAPIAPPAEQRRIVAAIEEHLSRVEAGVAALERVKKELARYRASVLKAACEGRLVPTEDALARAEGRSYEPAGELLARILAERRARWDRKKKYAEPAPPHTSSLPALPEGWVWATVNQLSWDSGYGTSEKCAYDGPGLTVLRIPNVSGARINLADLKRMVRVTGTIPRSEYVEPGDLLVVRTNGSRDLIGRAAVAETPLEMACSFASYLIRFRLCGGSTTWKFISLYWQTSANRHEVERQAATSAGQYNVSQKNLAALAVPLPPLAEQHRIVAEVERRLSIANSVAAGVDAALARAARLRQSILKRAFEGKLVPQDPNDEPASVLLARIRAEREAAGAVRPKKRRARVTGSVAAAREGEPRSTRRGS
jgi:type I restriction enzyme S subunit